MDVARGRPTHAFPEPSAPPGPAPRAVRAVDDGDGGPPGSAPRRYTAPAARDDPQREAHLGAVLQALRGGPLHRDELGAPGRRGGLGPGRLDAVVAHGLATGVLVETDDGAVRARYAD